MGRQCSHVLPKCPYDKLKAIVVKNSDNSESSDDVFVAKIINGYYPSRPYQRCSVYLNSGHDDFNWGNIDTFTDLNNYYNDERWYDAQGNCQNFNITQLKKFEIEKTAWLSWKFSGHETV